MIDLDLVKQLIESGEDDVLSIYLNVDAAVQENQANNPAWRIALKNGLGKIDHSQEDETEHQIWQTIYQRATDELDDYVPSSRGLAMFISSEHMVVYHLPASPPKNIVAYGLLNLTPLLWTLDEYEQYLVALVDKDEAHFLTSYMSNIDRLEAMASDRFTYDFRQKTLMPHPTGPKGDSGTGTAGGSYRDRFDDKMGEWIARFHREVADHIRDRSRKHGIKRVVLGGDEKAACNVRDYLHNSVRDHLVGVLPIPMSADNNEVLKRVLPVALDYGHQQETRLVEDVIGHARAEGGRGTLGYDAIEKALKHQQVDLLVAMWPEGDGEALNALLINAIRSGAEVEFVRGEAAEMLAQHGGIAARLYYAVPQV